MWRGLGNSSRRIFAGVNVPGRGAVFLWHEYSSVVVNDFDFVSVAVAPDEADTVLVIDADGVPSATVALESLETIARRATEIVQDGGKV